MLYVPYEHALCTFCYLPIDNPEEEFMSIDESQLLHNNHQWTVSNLSISNRRCNMIRWLTKDVELSFIHSRFNTVS